jgi:hypothetical protein
MAETPGQAKQMSQIQRLVGVFWEPKPVFRDLAARPRWWVPLVLSSLLSIAYLATFSRVVGWDTYMQRQFETNPRMQEMTAEQRQQAMEMGGKIGVAFGYTAAVVGPAVFSLIIAGILLGTFNTFGGAELKFKTAFSATVYSFLPSVIGTILSIVTMFLKNPEDFNLENPLILNVGAFLDPQTTPKWLHGIATSLDLFSIWIILLLALGLSVAGGKRPKVEAPAGAGDVHEIPTAGRELPYGKSLTLVVLLWAIWVLLKAGWAALFS